MQLLILGIEPPLLHILCSFLIKYRAMDSSLRRVLLLLSTYHRLLIRALSLSTPHSRTVAIISLCSWVPASQPYILSSLRMLFIFQEPYMCSVPFYTSFKNYYTYTLLEICTSLSSNPINCCTINLRVGAWDIQLNSYPPQWSLSKWMDSSYLPPSMMRSWIPIWELC